MSHDGWITTFQGIRHVPESRYNFISLGALQGEGFSFSFEGDLMKVSKEPYAKFQVKHVGSVYMSQNSNITVGGLQLSSASKAAIVKQSETTIVSSSDVQLYLKERLRLGIQQVTQIVTPMMEQILRNSL